MAGLNIPGVTDQYKTNETVEKLMQIERIPLTREQEQLDAYKAQKDAWREVNTQLSSLRESIKSLYSYENPFNSKLASSTDENAITASANRSAEIQSFKIDVIQPATADRFLTDELSSDFQVPQGVYTYKVGDKQVTINWKGGTLKNFSDAINKRGNGVIKSMIIGASSGKKSLLIESCITGKDNKLIFEGAAKQLALSTGMVSAVSSSKTSFGTSNGEYFAPPPAKNADANSRMPSLSLTRTKLTNGSVLVEPRGAFQINIPDSISSKNTNHITFTIRSNNVEDITQAINKEAEKPVIPDAGYAEFKGIVVRNMGSEAALPEQNPQNNQPLSPVNNKNVVYALMADGSEKLISTPTLFSDSEISLDLPVSEYQGIKGIIVRNENTGYSLEVSAFSAYDSGQALGYAPNHAIEEAGDCIIKYEGITITRSTNDIDDVVPEITLHVHDRTEKTATINIKPDKEASKNALIEFVGKYNQVIAKINVLSQNKREIVEELDYLSDAEKEKLFAQLGMFQGDFTLPNMKSSMQGILTQNYRYSDYATLTLLAQIGISTNATGYSGSYSQSRLRGYLEIDEKKLDDAIENHLDEIKQLFGFDTDDDLIIDNGIAYNLDKQITAYTQTGGILALKTSTLDSKIKSSQTKITKLEDQMAKKEADLRAKYSSMESSLNSLENQQNSINNFTRQQQQNQQNR